MWACTSAPILRLIYRSEDSKAAYESGFPLPLRTPSHTAGVVTLVQIGTEHGGMYVGSDLAADIPQRGFEGGVRERLPLAFAYSQPYRGRGHARSALVGKITTEERPEIVGYRHARGSGRG